MKRVLIILCALIVWTQTFECIAVGGDELTVVFTGDTSGKLIACSCPNDPAGGLAERVTLINEIRKYESPFLLVEPGRMVSLFGEYEQKSAVTMKLMNMMGYDAAGIDTWEIFHGIAGTRAMREAALFPLLSASVVDKSGELAFEPFLVKDIGDSRVAVISLADSSGIYRIGAADVSDFSFLRPDSALAGALEQLPDGIDFVVVLSTMEQEKSEELLTAFPVIDLIVETNVNRPFESPKVTPAGVIVNPGGRGQFVGAITITRSQDGLIAATMHELIPVIDIPADIEAEALVEEYYESIGQTLVKPQDSEW